MLEGSNYLALTMLEPRHFVDRRQSEVTRAAGHSRYTNDDE